jgi:hypothetical protein
MPKVLISPVDLRGECTSLAKVLEILIGEDLCFETSMVLPLNGDLTEAN